MSQQTAETIKSAQKAHYDGISEVYAERIDRVSYDYYFRFTEDAILSAITSHFGENAEISGLDVGCGIGDFTAAISKKCQSMIGVDISSGMVSVADSAHQRPGLSFAASPSDKLDFPSATFDFSIAIHLLHHLADETLIKAVLQEMKRVTKDGGLIIIVDVNKLNPVSPLIQYLMVKRGVDTGLEKLVSPHFVTTSLRALGVEVLLHKGFCFVPHFFPWLTKFDKIFGRIFPSKIIGKDYLIAGKCGP